MIFLANPTPHCFLQYQIEDASDNLNVQLNQRIFEAKPERSKMVLTTEMKVLAWIGKQGLEKNIATALMKALVQFDNFN